MSSAGWVWYCHQRSHTQCHDWTNQRQHEVEGQMDGQSNLLQKKHRSHITSAVLSVYHVSRSAVNYLRPTTDSDVQALTEHSTCYLSLLAVNKKTTQNDPGRMTHLSN